MAIPKDDRIAFSLKIVSADSEARGLDAAKASILVEATKLQKLDTANKNLFIPVNSLVDAYQAELQVLNGITRTSITEQDILDSGAKKVQNHFFPNDLSITVPSLSGSHNVWTKVKPFAITFGIGKTYVETYPGTVTKESDKIQPILTLISSATANLDIENTSGQHVDPGTGHCSLPSYTSQATCEAATPTPGVWTPGIPTIVSFPAAITLKSNLVTAVNDLVTFLNTELSLIPVDPDNIAQNDAARNDISNVILVALNSWLAQPDFNPVPFGTTPLQFPTYDSNLLAPTKLHSSQLAALQTALNTRLSFVSTRTGQVDTALGNISQDLNTGDSTGSGLYFKRYNFMVLRLNALGGSLTQLQGLQTATGAQDSIKANILSTRDIYKTILPTSKLKANANGSSTIHLEDPSFIAPGDTVYVFAENQEELQRAVKSIAGDMVILNDVIPAKYTTSSKARLYKDLT